MSILYETLVYGKSVAGYPSVIVGLMVLGGVQLIMIGVVGEYIGKVLSEIKARPVYFIAEHERAQRAGSAHRRSCRATDPDRGGMISLRFVPPPNCVTLLGKSGRVERVR